MNVSKFFGDLSAFQIIVSVITIANAIAVAWVSKVAMIFSKGQDLILPQNLILITDGHAPRSCQVPLTVINNRLSVCTVESIDGSITDDMNNHVTLAWSQFYKQVEGEVQNGTEVSSFVVPPNSGKTIMLELSIKQTTSLPWETGCHKFRINCHLHGKKKPVTCEKTFQFIRLAHTSIAARAITQNKAIRYGIDLQ
jgi:hypothetical protein